LRHLPGRNGLPYLGEGLELIWDLRAAQIRGVARYGQVFRASSFGYTYVQAFGAEFNVQFLRPKPGTVSNLGGWSPFLGGLFDGGLMLRDGDDHRDQRRRLRGSFTAAALKGYYGLLVEQITRHLDSWPSGETITVYPRMKQLTLDVAARIFLGLEPGPASQRINRAFLDMVRASLALVRWNLPGGAYARGRRGRRILEETFTELITSRRAAIARGQGPVEDLLGRLCTAEDDAGVGFSDTEIVDHLCFMMMAAHDTSASALTAAIYLLGHQTEHQNELRERCLALDEPDAAELTGIAPMRHFLDETMRLYPPVPNLPRMTLVEMDIGGFTVPAHTGVNLSPLWCHHSDLYWDEPQRFDPGRFSPERAEHKRHDGAYVPFGSGPHTCLGMAFGIQEILLLLHGLLRRFRWQLPQSYQPRYPALPFPCPADGLRVSFEPIGTS